MGAANGEIIGGDNAGREGGGGEGMHQRSRAMGTLPAK